MTKHLVIVSDLHINSTVGLCSKQVTLDEGGVYQPSKSQLWLNQSWNAFWRKVATLEGEVVTVINGDLIDLNTRHPSNQRITTNSSIVLDNALELLGVVKELSSKIYIVRGTAAHVGPSAELENSIARELGAVKNEHAHSWWQLPLSVNGVLFDIAHHGKVGSKPWNRANPLNTLAAQIAFEHIKNLTDLPNVVIRSHNHTHADTHDNLPVRVIATPAWQLSTEYSYRLGIVNLADIGGLIFSCNDYEYTLEKVMYTPEARKIEVA